MAEKRKPSDLERDLRILLDRLCIEWGFCIPADAYSCIATKHHMEANEFAMEMLCAEGMIPEHETKWLRRIKQRFIEHFGTSKVDEHTYKRNE